MAPEGVWPGEPATREQDLKFVIRRGVNWAAGVEFFPGDNNLRVSLQMTGQHLLDAGDVLDPIATVSVGGEIEQPWARQRRHTRLRFQAGLDRADFYIGPEIAWSITDTHELTLSGHYFSGFDNTAGSFFEDHDMIRLGWEIHL